MLKSLTINGFTLIAQADVPFHRGFTAITGETGAGKSVLLKSLRIICGDKATPSLVRAGESKAVVEAFFDISQEPNIKEILQNLEIDADDELIIHREISESGKGRVRINGTIVSLSDLQTLGEELIQMHGQSEQLLLRDIRTHARMLDDYAADKDILQEYEILWKEWNNVKTKIAETEDRAKNLAAQKDFLKFQFEELTKANLRQGEEEELEQKVSSASKTELERKYLDEIQNLLAGENGLLDQSQILVSKMRTLAIKLPHYEERLRELEEVASPFESICKDILRFSPTQAMNPLEIDRANARIALIQKLKRKYRTDVDGLVSLTEQRKQELDCLENLDADLEELNRQASKVHEKLLNVARKLSMARIEAANRFDSSVESILHTLGMAKAVFKTEIEPQPLSPNGMDRIEFKLAPNSGEGERSLQKAVSGGELSRLLLSIKSVMAELDRVPLLIFDEVDSGISGEVGNSIGDALRKLGAHHQVLTITHLHQVACRANNHLAVSKQEVDGRTFTSVKELDKESRINEIVRMLGGEMDSAREHARQLLEANL